MKKIVLLIILFLFLPVFSVYADDMNKSDNQTSYRIFHHNIFRLIQDFPEKMPYSATALIQVEFPYETFECTAFMIGPHYAATWASCIYDYDTGKFANNVLVIPGAYGQNAKCGPSWGSRMYVMDTRKGHNQHYIGIIELKENLGSCSGWFGYQEITHSDSNRSINVISYDRGSDSFQYETSGVTAGYDSNFDLVKLKMNSKLSNYSHGAPVIYNGEYVIGIFTKSEKDTDLVIPFGSAEIDYLKSYFGK